MKARSLMLAATLVLAWTLFLVTMFHRETALDEQRHRDVALSQMRALFNEVVDMRDWNAAHGGVYVPITAETQPNPWLEAPDRDVTTTSGKRLTLVNPAYMTRQLAEITHRRRGIVLHLTSTKPLRPQNEPNPWEYAALESFERGAPEYVEFTDAPGQVVLRYMAPLHVEATCLSCHRKQGYAVGQIRGGLSIVAPIEQLKRSRQSFRRSALLITLLAWVLGTALVGAVATASLQRSRHVARLRELALVDELTGLYNRRGFFMLAEKSLQVARRTNRPDLLLYIDLNEMKDINDRLGHTAGDAALRRTAAVLHAAFRTSDTIARLGGDEFVVHCPNTDAAAAARLVAGLEAQVEAANAEAAEQWRLALSVGYAIFDPAHPVSLEELLSAADAAMYAAKPRRRP